MHAPPTIKIPLTKQRFLVVISLDLFGIYTSIWFLILSIFQFLTCIFVRHSDFNRCSFNVPNFQNPRFEHHCVRHNLVLTSNHAHIRFLDPLHISKTNGQTYLNQYNKRSLYMIKILSIVEISIRFLSDL